MNKKTAIAIALIIIIFLNTFFAFKYDTNLWEVIFNSQKLSNSEKQWLANHGSIIYGSDYNSPPLRYIGANGQYQGVIVDYMNVLSVNIETKIEFRPAALWNEAYRNVKNGYADCIDMIASPERNRQFGFSKPIYKLRGAVAFKKESNQILDVNDLKNKRIAVPMSDYAVEYLKNNGIKQDIVLTSNLNEALLKLENDEVDAVVGDEPVIRFIAGKLDIESSIRYSDEPLYEEDVVLAVPKNQEELLSILNKSIVELEKRKTMQKIQEKWFGAYSLSTSEKTEKAAYISISSLVIILLLSYIFYSWNRQLKKEVKTRTKQLNVSKSNLIETLDAFTDYLIVVDKNSKVIMANNSFCHKINKEREHLLGQGYEETIDFPRWDIITEMIKETFRSGQELNKEYKNDGNIFRINTFPIREGMEGSDGLERVLAVIRDVTSMKVSEKLLLHKDKMAAIGQLAAAVAHEIRTPLGLIRNYAYIIKKSADISQKNQKSIAAIENSVDRANSIIENLLNFSRLSPNVVVKTNMRKFLYSIFSLYTKMMQKKGIQYSIVCNEDIECPINQESMKHIISNLLSNAIDAIDENGRIEAKCIIYNEEVIIEISDNGSGIKEEDVEDIFNPFFTTKELGKGTGLGLYVVYNEVKKCSGEITVSSEYQKGTTFRISLPLKIET